MIGVSLRRKLYGQSPANPSEEASYIIPTWTHPEPPGAPRRRLERRHLRSMFRPPYASSPIGAILLLVCLVDRLLKQLRGLFCHERSAQEEAYRNFQDTASTWGRLAQLVGNPGASPWSTNCSMIQPLYYLYHLHGSCLSYNMLQWLPVFITKGSPLGDTLSLSCEASVGASGSNN